MDYKRTNYFLLFFLLPFSLIKAQNDIPIGSWRLHLSYHNTQSMAIAGNKVYAVSRDGLFNFDKDDNSINIISNLDQLSDNQMGEVAFSESNNTLVVAYRNGNIDLLKEDEIINIRSVLNSSFLDKTVNHLLIIQDIAYLATNFGVVEIDINKVEIKETYNELGTDGSDAQVLGLAVSSDSIFLATSQGLIGTYLNANKLDFRNWRTIDSRNNINQVAYFNNKLYYSIQNDRVYSYSAGTIETTEIAIGKTVNRIETSQENLVICTTENINLVDNQLNITIITGEKVINPQQALLETDGTLWYTGNSTGLIRYKNQEFDSFFPSSLLIQSIFKFVNINNQILALPGGYSDGLTKNDINASFSLFQEGSWSNFTSESGFSNTIELPLARDLNAATYVSSSKEVFVASFQDGILRWNTEENVFSVINAPPLNNVSGNTSITGLSTDLNSNIWVSNLSSSTSIPSIHKLSPDGNWESFTFNTLGSSQPLDILIDNADQKWVRLAGNNGILVFKDQGNFIKLTTQENSGNLPNDKVNSLILDKEGSIWIGTDDGVTEIFAPEFVLDGSAVNASEPRFDGKPLLDGEQITAIAVDGGNRKWIGTTNGLWLFSEDGSELIENFTQENSPLLSNHILDVIVHPVSGEVFIGTENGIISYRGTSTEGTAVHQNVKIFPNPVRPGFNGQVSISGLANNANVKITDISGNLVWQTQAAGGTAIWNGNSLKGSKVNTGVYLVFSINKNNLDTFVGKIAVVE